MYGEGRNDKVSWRSRSKYSSAGFSLLNVGIFPESKNDFIYCNPPFDELIEGSQESSYNHHGFIKIAEEFVEKGGQAVLLLPHSFLLSKRDELCRGELLSKRLIDRINYYQDTASPEDSKIALLMRKRGAISDPKIRILTRVDNRTKKKFEVRYSSLTKAADFSMNIDKLEQLQELKFLHPHDKGFSRAMTVSFSSMLREEISKNQRKLDDVKYGFHDLDKYSQELNKISSTSYDYKLRNVLKVRFVKILKITLMVIVVVYYLMTHGVVLVRLFSLFRRFSGPTN